tara:strand:- start:258 stop:1031 length:774 start_codon:yes stop_codon:yes gene_type:complete
MAISVNELYRFVQFVANKEQSGFIKPSEFNLAVDRAQMQFFMERYGNPAEYQPGRPIPRVAYNQTQKVSDDLRKFIKRSAIPVDVNGIMQYPEDYLHFSSATYHFVEQPVSTETPDDNCDDCPGSGTSTVTIGEITNHTVTVRPVDDSELSYLLQSSIVRPDEKNPVLTFYQEGVQYHPKNLGAVDFVYLRRPIKPEWSFNLNSNGRPEYDPVSSVDLEWPEQVFNEIAVRILSFVGVNLREGELTQYSEGKRQTGI